MGDLTLETATREHILKVWNLFHRNTHRAAKALHIGRTTLYRKLKEYGQETTNATGAPKRVLP